jgi:thioredoxin reductase (NADPH)
MFIAKFASKITVVHQFDKLQANKEFQEAAFAEKKISFLFSHEPREFVALDGGVRAVVTENLKTRQLETVEGDGVFIFVGMVANLEGVTGLELDQWGYVKGTDEMRTSMKDVFVAGDVRSKNQRQITTAVSDGTIAAMVIAKDLGA